MHFQFVTKITLVLISLAMNSRSLVISFFVILFGLTVTAYDIDENIVNLNRAITCIYSQTSLSLTWLMRLTERLTYLKILDIQVKIYQLYLYIIIHLLHNVFGLEMIKMLNFSYACMHVYTERWHICLMGHIFKFSVISRSYYKAISYINNQNTHKNDNYDLIQVVFSSFDDTILINTFQLMNS